MANFTRDWDNTTPLGTQDRSLADDYIRYTKVDVSDRLSALIYGFINGENDGKPGIKNAIFKQQSSAPDTPNADEIEIYALDDGSNCGMYAKNEDGYVKQWLKKSGTAIILNVADTDGVVMKTGNQTITGTKTFADIKASQNLDIGNYDLRAKSFTSDVAEGTAPLTVTSPTKVTNLNADKVDGYDVSAYEGGQSHTFPGGLIIKFGAESVAADTTDDVTYGSAFPNDFICANVSYKSSSKAAIDVCKVQPKNGYEKSILQVTNAHTSTMVIYWIAIGY